MVRKRTGPVIATYTLSLVITVAVLVVWVIYVVGSVTTIREVAGRVGFSNPNTHWILLGVGCGLLLLLIGGLTYQLAQALAAASYSAKQEEFLSNVTHELKSPLAGIKLHSQTLEDPSLPPDERSRSVGHILEETERMARLVDDILESSRLLDRKRTLELEPVDVKDFFERFLPAIETRMAREGVTLTSDVHTDARILASPEALERIMTNLLENATKFSDRGSEVRCRVRDYDDAVRIEVEDDGIGIPKKELPKIFDRFFQTGQETDDRRKGTGLGLSIVAGLVREMRGKVRAFSQEGRPGTRFVVDLPLAREPA